MYFSMHVLIFAMKSAAILTSSSQLIVSKPITSVLQEDCTKCSNCNKWCCKAIGHKETPPQSLVVGLQSTDKPSDEIAPVGKHTAVFGLPAVTNPAGSLKERHIVWTPVISTGEKRPLHLDSCCSVSLFSLSMLTSLLQNVQS